LDDGGSGVRRDKIDLIVARIVRDLVLDSIEKGTTAGGHKIKSAYPGVVGEWLAWRWGLFKQRTWATT
jgi:hypothetical protein